jgi:hypothetical protein
VIKEDVVKLAETTHGVFAGDLAALNALVEFARTNGRERLQALWDLGDRKHAMLYPPTGEDRMLMYQRRHMADRRRRWNKARRLYARLTGTPVTEINGADLDKEHQALWMIRRDMLLDGTQVTGREERNEMIRLFWEDIEQQLDQGLSGDESVGRSVLGLKHGE